MEIAGRPWEVRTAQGLAILGLAAGAYSVGTMVSENSAGDLDMTQMAQLVPDSSAYNTLATDRDWHRENFDAATERLFFGSVGAFGTSFCLAASGSISAGKRRTEQPKPTDIPPVA